MAGNVPIYDNHIHMSPSGRNVDALLEFQAAGGTGLTLITLPYSEVRIGKGRDFSDSFDITYRMAEKAKEATSLQINTAVGPYPILLLGLAEEHGLAFAVEAMKEGMEIAGRAVAEGKAQAIGEIGRPHFQVSEEIWEASNEVLLAGMRAAKENGCPVIIHSEAGTVETNRSLSEIARKAGLDPGMVIKHSSPPFVRDEETFGVMPSIPASREYIREALSKGSDRFMLETDYYDDPEKPGARMSVNTVPKRIKAMLANGGMTEENVRRICGEIPEKMFRG
ncbi:MAG: TatD family hydrolase [Candidatus Methanomethylophilaceae archaeon]|jgi:TatD-related deoxyribonuclease|nr:TatD family hydrolase [Candidatus Methanomethylophilaceae archaeon]NCA74602.1 metal-dependent hydrolase [Gammaproteobacteria bacterium]